MRAVVLGAGGFIGHHLTKYLKERGHFVRGVDIQEPKYEKTAADEFFHLDLRDPFLALQALFGSFDRVYHLSADMGGIGYIETHKAEIVKNNTRIDQNVLEAARLLQVGRLFYASSACVYPVHLQKTEDVSPLKEDDAYPANPEDGYGWAKLYTERACRHYLEDFGLQVRIARFHNVYGPLGEYDGGREKSPAALCRKIALAPSGGGIEVWGDGRQTRSYCYIDDCVKGIDLITESSYEEPINLGRNDLVSINTLIDIISEIAQKKIVPLYDLSKPQGVKGRNADTTLLQKIVGWEPSIPMTVGLKDTYTWIARQVS